jgi:hypothetical protein
MTALARLIAAVEHVEQQLQWLDGIERDYRDISRINNNYADVGPRIAKADGIALAVKEVRRCLKDAIQKEGQPA